MISPSDLKKIRKHLGLTAAQAAAAVDVKLRAWQAYETLDGGSAREMPEYRLKKFCQVYNLAYPPISNDGRILRDSCKVIAITAYKGGVGKSPITVDVATTLRSRGFKVAIVSNDVVFRCYTGKSRLPYPSHVERNPGIDYLDESEVLMYKGEIRDLEFRLDEMRKGWNGNTEEDFDIFNSELIERLDLKSKSKITFEQLTQKYDYILLDLNRDLRNIILLSNVIAVILDNNCLSSIWSARAFCEDMVKTNGGERLTNFFSLMTNHVPYTRVSSFLDYIPDEEAREDALKDIEETFERQARIYAEARSLDLPMLQTHLTEAHLMEVARFNSGKRLWDQYGYFDSVVTIAPGSTASEEIRRLTDELCSIVH